MKQNELYVTEAQSRLTEKEHQSYARSMHEPALEVDEKAKKKSPESRIHKITEKITAVFKNEEQEQTNGQQIDSTVGDNKENESKQTIDATTTAIQEHDLSSEPKVSLLAKVFGALTASVSNEKLLDKAHEFSESYKTLNLANADELKTLFISWEPETKDRTELLLSKTAQRMILEVVKDKGISTSIFLQAVNMDTPVKTQELIDSLSITSGLSGAIEKAVDRLLDEIEIIPLSEWNTEKFAKEFVHLQKAIDDSNQDGHMSNAVDTQVAQVLENFILEEVQTRHVSQDTFVAAITSVVYEEDGVAAVNGSQLVQEDDSRIEAEGASLSNTTTEQDQNTAIHSFDKPTRMPEQMSGGNDTAKALEGWKKFMNGEVLTREQIQLAEAGYMPLEEKLAVPQRADDGEAVKNPEAYQYTRLPFENVVMGADEDPSEGLKNSILPDLEAELQRAVEEGEIQASKSREERVREKVGKLRSRISRMDSRKLAALVRDGGELTVRRGSILSTIKRAKEDPELRADPTVPRGAIGLSEEKRAMEISRITELFSESRKYVEKELAKRTPEGIENARNAELELLDKLRKYEEQYPNEKRGKGKEGYEQVNDINDLCEQIGRSDVRFDVGGKYELINTDRSKGRFGEVNEQNFLIWIREQMVYWHGQDPDSEVKFFSQIAVDNNDLFRPINLGTMIANKSLYFKTKDNHELTDLYNEVTNLAWLIGGIRNMDISYRLQMSPEEKVGELIASLMSNNMLTKKSANKANTLESIFTMPARFYDVENHHDDEEDFIKKHRDMDLGDGIAVGLALYYNITDIEKLKKLVGKETTFFKRIGFEMALDKVAGVVDGDTVDEITSKRNDFLTRSQLIKKGEGYEKLLTKWFDGKTGELVKGAEKDFIDMLNVFVPEPNQQTVDIANQLIKQAITQLTNIHKKTEDPDNPQNSKVQDEAGDPTANFAQLVANLMSWWGGAAAKADTGVAAVNGMSKLKWVKSYKYKSTDPGRAGPIGNLYGMGNVQEVYVDVLTGMLTVDGKSVMEIVEQKIKDLKSGKSFEEKEKTAHQFNFNLNTAKQYGAAHATNANKIYLMEGGADMPHFHDFVDVNQWGTIRINADKMATEMQDKIIKPVRYAWSTHKMPFHKDVRKRIQDDPKAPEGMKDKYITVSQLENTFSRQVIKIGQEMFKHDMHHKFNMKADDPKAVEYFETNAHAKFYDEKAGRVYRFKVNENGDYVDKNGKAIHMPHGHHGKGGHHQSEVDWLLKNGVTDWNATDATKDFESKMPKEIEKLMDNKIFRNVMVRAYLVTRFGGMLYGNSVRKSPYKFLDIMSREHAIEGLEAILTKAVADEDDFHNNNIEGHFFSHFDIQMLRKLSRNEKWRNVAGAFGQTMGSASWESAKEFWAFFWKNAFS